MYIVVIDGCDCSRMTLFGYLKLMGLCLRESVPMVEINKMSTELSMNNFELINNGCHLKCSL